METLPWTLAQPSPVQAAPALQGLEEEDMVASEDPALGKPRSNRQEKGRRPCAAPPAPQPPVPSPDCWQGEACGEGTRDAGMQLSQPQSGVGGSEGPFGCTTLILNADASQALHLHRSHHQVRAFRSGLGPPPTRHLGPAVGGPSEDLLGGQALGSECQLGHPLGGSFGLYRAPQRRALWCSGLSRCLGYPHLIL